MKKGLAVAMAALLGVATMGTTAMAAASGVGEKPDRVSGGTG